uniref:28S ribosomal protein S30, mitochondrial n=1 Tax=Setaria digitata TaxID=48799 RepID=A0A915PFN4_9BILA
MHQRLLCTVTALIKRFKSTKKDADVTYYIPPKTFRPPYYHPMKPSNRKSMEPFPPFPNKGDSSGMGPRLYDYQVMSELVRSLPTATERIDFVNPYEREFTRREKRTHRPWHAALLKTRKAWRIQPFPNYFDPLSFYQYIAKTRCIDGLSKWYDEPAPVLSEGFERRLGEILRLHLESDNVDSEEERTARILRSFVDLLLENIVRSGLYACLTHHRISHTPRCESFWIRCGFDAIYENENRARHRGDNREKLGELAFVMRDAFATQLRTKHPLKPLMSLWDEEVTKPLFSPEFNIKDELIYSPAMFGMIADSDPLWQCPGYEPDCGEEYKYGHVGFKQFNDLDVYCKRWKVKGEEEKTVRNECLRASAVISLFSWLNAQAHALGYTQYNDIEQPLVSQLVLSDGKQFFFAIAQLNTLVINVDIEGIINKRSNLCYVEGPINLYDRYDCSTGEFEFHKKTGSDMITSFNPHVLGRLMQMLVRDMPTKRDVENDSEMPQFIPVTFDSLP